MDFSLRTVCEFLDDDLRVENIWVHNKYYK